MPSLRDQIEVVGTGGSLRICAIMCGSCTDWPLTSSKKRQALVALGLEANGLPSVIT
mgnify:CR=1 FL=1